ncbi:MAG TPA: glycosyltransferase [Candidatus Acetatifactor stercoripullorum]|uniref:Glycosyltransferase n=1 Tax=Candidatus Acetatifactor stercoripullorum TaxID=2838414 RepID=A0A9D1R2M6_9FIRM|nr:glycosyltransferase family 2 protein [uncultured Acetatifactor sp.]HIW80358.1 glycosyltransferase [Candidatus Acetatifactor stercoripullorum]
MQKEIRLTIAIPTYNRCDLLHRTLESVMTQWSDCIEVIVSDNASTDGTEAMMEAYSQEKKVRYFRNPENLGMDKNFLKCLQLARGEYIHLLSDDDILLPGAVAKILSLIESERPNYINLNSFTYSTDLYNPNEKKNPRINVKEDIVTKDKKTYMELIGVYITYISATIIRKSDFLKIQKPERYFGTYFLHAHLVLEILKEKTSKVVITRDAYIAAKNNNSGGFNLYEVWIKQYKNLLLSTAVRNGFDRKMMKNIYVNDVNGFIKDSILKYSVTDNAYEMSHRSILFRYTYMYPEVWIKTYKYALLPRFILKKIYARKRKKGVK